MLDYCEQLERRGRYQLYLWPPHCLLGSRGHTMVGVVQEARLFHAYARRAEAEIEIKGTSLLTEHYSVLGAGDRHGARRHAARDGVFTLAEKLMAADRLVIAGQASSHCVKNTLEDLLRWIERARSERAGAREGLRARGLHVGGGGAGSRSARDSSSRTSPRRRRRRSIGAGRRACTWCASTVPIESGRRATEGRS